MEENEKSTEKLVKIIRKGLYGSEDKREIRSFLNIFPSLEEIIKNQDLTIQENIDNFNKNLKQINEEVPNLILNIWGIYRRNLLLSTFVINTKKTIGLPKKKLDIYLANEYLNQIEIMGKTKSREIIGENENGFIYGPEFKREFYSIEEESPFELFNIEKRTNIPIDIYTFKNKFSKKIIKIHYDLSNEKIPYLKEFIDEDMSFETRNFFNDLRNEKNLKKEYLSEYYRGINKLKDLDL